MQFNQELFFEILQTHFTDLTEMADWMAVSFDMDVKTAYRRIRCESKLTLSEFTRISYAKPEFMAQFISRNDGVPFKLFQMSKYHNEEELQRQLHNLKMLFGHALTDPNSLLNYIARDVSFFVFISHPTLLRFKYGFWNMDKSMPALSKTTHDLAIDVYGLYTQLKSREIYLDQAYAIQRNQLDALVASKFISAEFGSEIHGILTDSLSTMEKWIADGCKDGKGEVQFGTINFMSLNNGGILHAHGNKLFMGAIDNARFISTSSEEVIGDIEKHFKFSCSLEAPLKSYPTQHWDHFRSLWKDWK